MARILIVEDEPLISMMLEDWICEMGHEPLGPVSTVQGAMDFIGTTECDAAILDLNLHRQRSDAVADMLCSRGVPFAFATGESPGGIDTRFSNRPTVTKPYNYEGVERVVTALIAHPQPAASGA